LHLNIYYTLLKKVELRFKCQKLSRNMINPKEKKN